MNYNPNIAHIVYAADDKFAEILGVSLLSLYENSKDMEDIIVYILDSGICEDNRRKLEHISVLYQRCSPVWIQAKNISKELDIEVAVDRGSWSQYARLFVSRDLPTALCRVLYLDCDIIIQQSIRELWNLNLHGKTIAALMDAFSKQYRANIDLREKDIMFNSGVMLIDLERWKKNQIEQKLLQFIAKKKGKIQQGDQGALNHVLSHDIYCFEPRFNSVTIFYDFTYQEMMLYRKPPEFYPPEQIAQAVQTPSIIHFTTSFVSKRPWMEGCQHKYVGEWLKYKEMSPWKDTPLWKDNRAKWKQVGIAGFQKLPRGCALYFAGLMQAYARPYKNRLRK